MSSHFAELAQPMILKMEEVACDFLKKKPISFNNLIKVTCIKYKRNFGLFAAAFFSPIFAQIEFQLKQLLLHSTNELLAATFCVIQKLFPAEGLKL